MISAPNILDVAFKGGGAKGFIDVGVGLEFDRLGISQGVRRAAGASVGAMFSLFFASGKPATEIQRIAFSTDFLKIIDNHWAIVNIWDLMTDGGLHDGKELQQFFKDFIKDVTGDENTTFTQWHTLKETQPERHLKDLYITACNISRRCNEVFSWENPRLKDVPIWQAVAASAAFPGYFEPVEITIAGVVEKFSDGGLQDNCPIDVFNLEGGIPNPNAIGIWLASTAEILFIKGGILPPIQSISGPIETFKAQIESQLEGDTFRLHDSAFQKKMVLCDNLGIGTLDFNMSDAQKEMLVISGIISVFFYFATHFPDFAARHYSKSVFSQIGITQDKLSSLGFDDKVYAGILEKLKGLPAISDDAFESDIYQLFTPMRALSLRDTGASSRSSPAASSTTSDTSLTNDLASHKESGGCTLQ